eukprot:5897857-Prymnesium_polylepis.2
MLRRAGGGDAGPLVLRRAGGDDAGPLVLRRAGGGEQRREPLIRPNGTRKDRSAPPWWMERLAELGPVNSLAYPAHARI